MDHILVSGGNPLKGSINISGAKNAALPLLAASLLTEQKFTLTNVPDIADINLFYELLIQHGCHVDTFDNGVTIDASHIINTTAPYDLVCRMRASVLVLGPLLTRFGKAKVSLPGGCAIGTRPVDLHISGLKLLGAQIDLVDGYIYASAPNGLIGATISMPLVSVSATENLMMAAVLAKGTTTLVNAAREPEIADLAKCLIAMGAIIKGAGTDRITIEGVETLTGVKHHVISDRIETGTYAVAALMTKGELSLFNTDIVYNSVVISTLEKAGALITPIGQEQDDPSKKGFHVTMGKDTICGVDMMTEPYPGFATDMQAQMMGLMALCEGASMITETIFENRFMHVPELCRMGANITVHGSSALVRGVKNLSGAPVMASDIRASASLILAGLAAKGTTQISRVYHLDRGYDRIVEKLQACGAVIERKKII